MWEPRLNDYAGYALAAGSFRPRSPGRQPQQVAVGAPRAGVSRAGTVFVVAYDGTENLDKMQRVIGRQTGEYFGAALAAADVNGDGADELIVGAPLFTNTKETAGGNTRVRMRYSTKA